MVEFPTDPAQAAAWLADRRWYGEKSRTINDVQRTDLATVRVGEQDVVLASIDLTFDDGGGATYFIPLHAGPNGEACESLAVPEFQDWIGRGYGEDRHLDAGNGAALTWHRSHVVVMPWWEESAALLEGEQSNTSIRFGDDAIVKVFRKWQSGVNPDTEIVEFLTERTRYRQVPSHFGSIRLSRGDATIEVAAVQNFVANDGDSWKWLPGALANLDSDQEPSLLAQIRLLGQRTGELHVALASGEDEAFAPETLTAADVEAIADRVERELRETMGMLERGGHLPASAATDLQQGLEHRLQDVSSLAGTQRTRVHGDYHLGQVLRSEGDFVIIDFEGEPSRTMAERRMKHSPLKDVAGMLRSLDYAVATAALGASPAASSRLADIGQRMEAAFLDGYREAIARGPADLLPSDGEAFAAALNLYMVEKALYETRYELDNRPDWLGIPLGALQRIAAAS